MAARNYVVQNVKNIPLKTLKAIQANQYRSKNNEVDYDCFEIEQRINELETKKAEKMVEEAKSSGTFDAQLLAVLSIDNKQQYILNLLDKAFQDGYKGPQINYFIDSYGINHTLCLYEAEAAGKLFERGSYTSAEIDGPLFREDCELICKILNKRSHLSWTWDRVCGGFALYACE